jgi:hypothetical protein
MGVERTDASPSRAVSPPRSKRPGAPPKTAFETITVYVATCQIAVFDNTHSEPSSYATPVFKQVKFQTLVRPTATLEDLRYFLMSQWAITKSEYALLPPSEQYYTFKGRILRLDGTLDGFCACGLSPFESVAFRALNTMCCL